MTFRAVLFDFDGVLIESEYEGNRHLAEFLTAAGHPLTVEEAVANFSGHSGQDFLSRVEGWIGGPMPGDWAAVRRAENRRAMEDGVAAVAGAIDFVRALDLPRAVVSSSSTRWLGRHLGHLGLADLFGEHVYSGAEHVARGKPAPDLYLFAAERLGVPIGDCLILEDSVVGATGAVASGGYVVGLCAGTHCSPGHDARLRAAGVQAIAHDYAEVTAIVTAGVPSGRA